MAEIVAFQRFRFHLAALAGGTGILIAGQDGICEPTFFQRRQESALPGVGARVVQDRNDGE
jgi:hypothetical protein